MKRRATVLLGAGLFAACSDGSAPMGPDPTALEPNGPAAVTQLRESFMGSPGAPLSALIPVEDALERIMGVLPGGAAKDDLDAALSDLGEAIEAADGCVIRASRRAAEHALRDLGKGQPDEYEADFDAVRLALESVEQQGKGKC